MGSHVFISYKHGDPSTKIAEHLNQYLLAYADAWGYEHFLDNKTLKAGDDWSAEVEAALDRTTHFIALIDTAYWLSPQCRRELFHALNRFEKDGSCRLLFVKAQEVRPQYFRFDSARKQGELVSPDPAVRSVGSLHFLGPFDRNNQLVRLAWDKPAELLDHMAQLMDRLFETLPKPA